MPYINSEELHAEESQNKSTRERIESLQSKHKIIRKKQSSVKLLVARYDVEQSFFDKAAKWYGSLGWWKKALVAVAATSASILAGATSPLGIIASIFCSVVALIGHFLLSEHHRIGEERLTRIKNDIVELEHELTRLVADLSQVEDELQEALSTLTQEELELQSLCESYQSQITSLEAEVARIQESSDTLDEEKENLVAEIEGFKTQLSISKESLSSANASIESKALELEQSQRDLQDSKDLLEQSNASVKLIESDYTERLAHLAEMNGLMKAALEPLQDLNRRREDLAEEMGAETIEDIEERGREIKENTKRLLEQEVETDRLLESLGIVIEYDDIGISEGNSAVPT